MISCQRKYFSWTVLTSENSVEGWIINCGQGQKCSDIEPGTSLWLEDTLPTEPNPDNS